MSLLGTRERKEQMVLRVRMLSALLGVLLAAVLAAYWVTQGIEGAKYVEMAELNRHRVLPIQAPRGVIFDRDGRPLAENVPSYALRMQPRVAGSVESSLRFAAAVLDVPYERLAERLAAEWERDRNQPALLATHLSLPQVAAFEAAGYEHPEFEIETRQVRLYRHRGQTAHLMGYLSEVTKEELAATPGKYLRGELIGRRGIEDRYDASLRGRNGELVQVVDSRGRPLQEYRRKEAEPGRDLHLTLDLDLQQAASRALGDQIGAVVALDPRDGEVRALVSSPSYDPNLFARGLQGGEWQRLIGDTYHPLQNRAIQNTHSPGSTFKLVMGLAGLEEGLRSTESTAFCSGAAVFYGHRRRCWKKEGHGSVNLYRAIKHSCDIYFYALGQDLGIDRIAKYARSFGFGSATGIDLDGEKPGLVPSSEWSQRVRKHPWYPGETISVAIGQGPLLTTPVQMAVMMAAVANGGTLVTPHLVAGSVPPQGETIEFSPAQWQAVRKGAWGVVEDMGTAFRTKVEGLPMAGKTGTVQVVAQETWIKSKELPFDRRDHGWFVAYAPFDAPELVVAVFVEHGGGGSSAAAPIAKAVYEAFVRKRPDFRDPQAA